MCPLWLWQEGTPNDQSHPPIRNWAAASGARGWRGRTSRSRYNRAETEGKRRTQTTDAKWRRKKKEPCFWPCWFSFKVDSITWPGGFGDLIEQVKSLGFFSFTSVLLSWSSPVHLLLLLRCSGRRGDPALHQPRCRRGHGGAVSVSCDGSEERELGSGGVTHCHLVRGPDGGVPQSQRQSVSQRPHGSPHSDLCHRRGLRSLCGAEQRPSADGQHVHHRSGWGELLPGYCSSGPENKHPTFTWKINIKCVNLVCKCVKNTLKTLMLVATFIYCFCTL